MNGSCNQRTSTDTTMNRKSTNARTASRLLTAAVLVGLAACGGSEAAETTAETAAVLSPQDVATAEQSTISSGVTLTGTLEPYRQVEIRAQVPGVVTNVRVDRGDAVREGQRLARIQAEGITSQASGAQAQVAAAEAGLAQARRQLESARTLFDAGAMSEIEFQAAQTQYESAQAQLTSAGAQATGAIEQAGRTTIESPISGEVSQRIVNEGEAVNVGAELFTVVNSQQLELAGQVPVDQAAQVREGQSVEFSLDAYPGRTFRGTVARVDPTADPATRQVGVAMRLPNEDRALIGGLFATGRVITGTEQQAVVIPTAAIRGTNGGSYVYVVESDTIARREVVVGPRDESRGVVAITSGVQAGERVITAPGAVETGTRVQVAAANSSEDGGR